MRTIILLWALVCFSMPALGQIPLKRGIVEVSFYSGGTFDLPGAGSASIACSEECEFDIAQGSKSLPLIGASLSIPVTRFLWIYGDYAYAFPDHNTSSVVSGGFAGSNSSNRQYWVASGGAELSFPTIHTIVPLLRFGVGTLHQSYDFRNYALDKPTV